MFWDDSSPFVVTVDRLSEFQLATFAEGKVHLTTDEDLSSIRTSHPKHLVIAFTNSSVLRYNLLVTEEIFVDDFPALNGHYPTCDGFPEPIYIGMQVVLTENEVLR